MTIRTLVFLAGLHRHFGLISDQHYEERCLMAEWIYDDLCKVPDPRIDDGNEPVTEEASASNAGEMVVVQGDPADPSNADKLSFLFNQWVFTKADPDPCPSTPHGHWQHQNNKWPKLDPYNGRVFKTRHNEDTSKRLRRDEMRALWRNERFKEFCREHLIWYMEQHPHHVFRVAEDRIFRFPHW